MIAMCRTAFLGAALFFAGLAILSAQDNSSEDSWDNSLERIPGLRERAVVMHCVSRIVERNQQVVWNSEMSRVTIPGRPVGLTLVGSNVVVAVQFTPFLQRNGQHTLVAQAQIAISIPNEGMRYHTTIQTIPIRFGEQVYFFPLGSMETEGEARIEIQLALEQFSETNVDSPRGRGPHHGPRPPVNAGTDQ
jgi:hypothetical protein